MSNPEEAKYESLSGQKLMWGFILLWFVLNVLQSVFTELFHDEALYWLFAQRPALGYFDHPPLTAWLIASFDWIPGELGVRMPFILMTCATIYFLFKLIDPKDGKLLIWLLIGVPLMHVGGFFAAPDVSLIFLLTIFLYFYKSYYYEDSWTIAIVLGILLALMGYAKYHAILFAIALVLSNVELFRRRSFYLMVVIAAVLILPHFFWQWQHDWVSFNFHLFNRRGAADWSWLFVGDYVGGQLGVYGLFMALILFAASIRYHPEDHFECAFKYTFFIVMGFFTLSVFRGRVEANWTAMALPAMLYLSYFFIEGRAKWRRWTIIAASISLCLVMAVRLLLAFEILDPSTWARNETHGFENWAQEVQSQIGNRTPVFMNNYQHPAKYAFYSGGEEVYAYNTARYSGSQWILWKEDEINIQGKRVALISNEVSSSDTVKARSGFKPIAVKMVDDWISYNFLDIHAQLPSEARSGELFEDLNVEINNPTSFDPLIMDGKVQLGLLFYQNEKLRHRSILIDSVDMSLLTGGQKTDYLTTFHFPDTPGDYTVKLSLRYNGFDGWNGLGKKISIE